MDDQWQFRLSKSESVSIKEGFKRFTVILRKVCSLQISANLNNSCLLSLPILTPITSRVFVVFWSRTLLASVEYLQNKFCFKVAVCCIAAGCPSLPPPRIRSSLHNGGSCKSWSGAFSSWLLDYKERIHPYRGIYFQISSIFNSFRPSSLVSQCVERLATVWLLVYI